MTGRDAHTIVTIQKEESLSRIQSDATDREKIRNKLLTCIDPLNPERHRLGLINFVTGCKSQDSVNVDISVPTITADERL